MLITTLLLAAMAPAPTGAVDTTRAAVIALGRSGGDSEKVASEDADMQIEDYHANFTDKFKDYKANNSLPGE